MTNTFGFAIGCFFIASVIVAFGMSRVAPTPLDLACGHFGSTGRN
jgi:hypothetical protein